MHFYLPHTQSSGTMLVLIPRALHRCTTTTSTCISWNMRTVGTRPEKFGNYAVLTECIACMGTLPLVLVLRVCMMCSSISALTSTPSTACEPRKYICCLKGYNVFDANLSQLRTKYQQHFLRIIRIRLSSVRDVSMPSLPSIKAKHDQQPQVGGHAPTWRCTD